jgi:predicted nucleic acid-binding protein
VLGGRASLVLTHPKIEAVFTTGVTYAEVEEYSAVLGRKRRLSADTMMLAVAALPVSLIEPAEYKGKMARARLLLRDRDPDDVELLALALHLQVPLWSNDNDFEGCGIEWLTTAEALRELGIFGSKI